LLKTTKVLPVGSLVQLKAYREFTNEIYIVTRAVEYDHVIGKMTDYKEEFGTETVMYGLVPTSDTSKKERFYYHKELTVLSS